MTYNIELVSFDEDKLRAVWELGFRDSEPEWARWDVLAFMIFLIFVVLLFISTMWHFLRSRR